MEQCTSFIYAVPLMETLSNKTTKVIRKLFLIIIYVSRLNLHTRFKIWKEILLWILELGVCIATETL
jgi:hypothetical protein